MYNIFLHANRPQEMAEMCQLTKVAHTFCSFGKSPGEKFKTISVKISIPINQGEKRCELGQNYLIIIII